MIKKIDLQLINNEQTISKIFTDNFIKIDNIKQKLTDNPFSNYIIYILNNEVVAFTNYLLIYDKMEIADIAVKDIYRHKNIASIMMNYLIDESIKKGCKNITLEVNKNNAAALKLYKKFNFKKVAIREKYYGKEDGILMEKKLVI